MTKRCCFFFAFGFLALMHFICDAGAQDFVREKSNGGNMPESTTISTQNALQRQAGEKKPADTKAIETQGGLKFQPAGTYSRKGALMQDNNENQNDLIRLQNFRYRLDRAVHPSGEVIVLLHGSGGDETTLFSFARPIWPRATLVGIRGRLVQKGETRWYRKISPTKFDQQDVVREADGFVKFLESLGEDDNYDLSRATFVGYSNGANLLAVIMMRHPDLVRRAILMRSMPVLDTMPHENLSKTRVLTISGKKDKLYSPFAPALSALLRENGARVESRMVDGDHMIGKDDAEVIKKWVAEQNFGQISAATKTGRVAP